MRALRKVLCAMSRPLQGKYKRRNTIFDIFSLKCALFSVVLTSHCDSYPKIYFFKFVYVRALQKVCYVLYLDLYRGSYSKKTTFFHVLNLKYALFSVKQRFISSNLFHSLWLCKSSSKSILSAISRPLQGKLLKKRHDFPHFKQKCALSSIVLTSHCDS